MTEAATIMPHTGDPTPTGAAPADDSPRPFIRQVADAYNRTRFTPRVRARVRRWIESRWPAQ